MNAIVQPKLTKRQREAMDAELNAQIAKQVPKLAHNIMALVLWYLHEKEGYGRERLTRLNREFAPAIRDLQQYYEMSSHDDTEWLVKKKLRDIGVDVEALDNELGVEVAVV